MLSMCARIAAASSSCPFAVGLIHKVSDRTKRTKTFDDIFVTSDQFFCFMCLLWPGIKAKYVSGVSRDANGIAVSDGPAILCGRATPASMDDCLRRVVTARDIRGHQSRRASASARLGAGNRT